jgi:dihydrofolate synthase/folylpolyglutamate synthase
LPSKAPSASAPLEDWLRWQEALHPQAIALGLERVREVGQRLGVTGRGAATITVAGTNGKGSTATLLARIYEAGGFRTGLYTSPHLRRYNERLAIDGEEVADRDWADAFSEVEEAREGVPLTYFEFGTLAALWLLRQNLAQVQVLEIGMGGRLDAVNLVEPDVALVTNVGLDHQEFLGKDRETIGFEKAGIFRKGLPAICVDPDPPRSVGDYAHSIGARFWQLDRDFSYQYAADAWNWQGGDIRYKKLPPPALAGEAQFRNAAGAIAAVARAQKQVPVNEAAIRTGLSRLRLPARFEQRGGLHANLVLDVAHNVEAARVLADNLRAAGHTRCRFVIGMLSDKPVEGFAAQLARLACAFYAGGLPPPRGLTGAALAKRLTGAPVVSGFETVAQAYTRAKTETLAGETLVVCGSFQTVAAVSALIDG